MVHYSRSPLLQLLALKKFLLACAIKAVPELTFSKSSLQNADVGDPSCDVHPPQKPARDDTVMVA